MYSFKCINSIPLSNGESECKLTLTQRLDLEAPHNGPSETRSTLPPHIRLHLFSIKCWQDNGHVAAFLGTQHKKEMFVLFCRKPVSRMYDEK